MGENVKLSDAERAAALACVAGFRGTQSGSPAETLAKTTLFKWIEGLCAIRDAEATERAAKVCDDRVEWSYGSPYEPACPRNSESQEAYDCASAIRSTLARKGKDNSE